MIDIFQEMTQGDSFYAELAFVDAYGAPIDLSVWTVKIDFKLNFSDTSPLFSLTETNGGITLLADTGAISFQFDESAVSSIDINPTPRNGELVPSRTIFGDVKLTPPAGTIIGTGSRPVIPLKIYLGVTA